jgi:hypothetical protein
VVSPSPLYPLFHSYPCYLSQTHGTRYFSETSSPSLLLFTDLQDPAIPRFRLGHGGYHRSTRKLYLAQGFEYQLMIANKQERHAFQRD